MEYHLQRNHSLKQIKAKKLNNCWSFMQIKGQMRDVKHQNTIYHFMIYKYIQIWPHFRQQACFEIFALIISCPILKCSWLENWSKAISTVWFFFYKYRASKKTVFSDIRLIGPFKAFEHSTIQIIWFSS